MKPKRYPKPGKPVTHPPIIDINTGKIYRTYTEAANDIHGDRTSVMRVCEGMQNHNKKHVFRYITKDDIKDKLWKYWACVISLTWALLFAIKNTYAI